MHIWNKIQLNYNYKLIYYTILDLIGDDHNYIRNPSEKCIQWKRAIDPYKGRQK